MGGKPNLVIKNKQTGGYSRETLEQHSLHQRGRKMGGLEQHVMDLRGIDTAL